MPESNAEFWQEKFRRNRERDARVQAELESMGWKVITIWECEVKGILSSGLIPGLNAPEMEDYEEEERVLEAAEEDKDLEF